MIKINSSSSLCGQACLGTILKCTLQQAINLIGHTHGTYTWEMARFFDTEFNEPTRGIPNKYSLCRVNFKNIGISHWVLYKKGKIYDPTIGDWLRLKDWQDHFAEIIPYITSYAEIKKIIVRF